MQFNFCYRAFVSRAIYSSVFMIQTTASLCSQTASPMTQTFSSESTKAVLQMSSRQAMNLQSPVRHLQVTKRLGTQRRKARAPRKSNSRKIIYRVVVVIKIIITIIIISTNNSHPVNNTNRISTLNNCSRRAKPVQATILGVGRQRFITYLQLHSS